MSAEPTSTNPETETLEQLTSRHKKELKSFDGQKRAAIKTAKSKGKKAKSAVKEVEFKYEGLERDLKERHRREVEELTNALNGVSVGDGEEGTTAIDNDGANSNDTAASSTNNEPQPETQTREETAETTETELTPEEILEQKRQKALQKKLKKKSAARQKELDREQRISTENAAAGPSPREMEMEALEKLYLNPRGLRVEEVEADGNCLYRAVGVQCDRLGLSLDGGEGNGGRERYQNIRSLCAKVLMGPNRAEYEPFAEFGPENKEHGSTYEEYVEIVKSSSVWGGQLELRALSEGLSCPIVVFSAEGNPLVMGAEYGDEGGVGVNEDWGKKKAVLLSFHRRYYALGEHYNSVVLKADS